MAATPPDTRRGSLTTVGIRRKGERALRVPHKGGRNRVMPVQLSTPICTPRPEEAGVTPPLLNRKALHALTSCSAPATVTIGTGLLNLVVNLLVSAWIGLL